MIYELRTYTMVPLKRPQVVELLREAMPVFARAGIEVVGVWTTIIGRAQTFRYLLRYESLADRETKWNKFVADPEVWRLVEKYGPICTYEDNEFLQPTNYSPLLK